MIIEHPDRGALARRLRYLAEPGTWISLGRNARWYRDDPCRFPEPTPGPRALVRWPAEYDHAVSGRFVRGIREGFEAVASLVITDLPQPYSGIVLLEIDPGDGLRRVALDWYDLPRIDPECAAEVDTYFKFQYQRGGYPGFANIKPGGYVTDAPFLYAHWCRLRALRRQARPTSDVFARFGLRASASVRAAAIEALRSDARIRYSGGSRSTHYPRYLREMARARVCVDMPGQGPFCCRLVEGLAMGCCFVAARHNAEMPASLRDGVELVYCKDDLSDLAELCVEYAHDAGKRAPIEAAAARFFDEHLHPLRMAEHYLRVVRGDASSSRGDAPGDSV